MNSADTMLGFAGIFANDPLWDEFQAEIDRYRRQQDGNQEEKS